MCLVVAGGGVRRRVDGQVGLVGDDGRVVYGLAVGVQRVPEGQRHAEEPLPADQPVAVQAVDPVGVPGLHVGGMPGDLVAAGDEVGPKGGIPAAVSYVPLAAGHDLERLVALLEELDRVRDGLRLAHHLAGLPEHLDHLRLCREDGLARQAPVGGEAGFGPDAGGWFGVDPAGPVDDGPYVQVQLAPPGHVGGVAERADHGCAGALLGVGQFVGHDRHVHAEHRRGDGRAEQRLVALVVRVGHQGDAGCQQLGAGGGDVDVAATVGSVECQRVVGAGSFPVLQLGLCHGGAVCDVPERRSLDLVRLAASQVPEEAPLGDALAAFVDGGVVLGPVDRQAEAAEQGFEGLLVLGGQHMAELDEVAAADG